MIAVPYHLGRRAVEVGRGPLAILQALAQPCTMIERTGDATSEVDAVADVNTQLAHAVASHHSPVIVLAGNCNSCLGTLSALEDPGIVWFDAHGDFNTPETSISGALEGMSLAIATGHCYPALMPSPVPEEHVVLAATRSIDPLEEVRLRASKIVRAGRGYNPWRQPGDTASNSLTEAIDELATRVKTIYLHLDLDVLDPSFSPGVNFSSPGGISPDELYSCVQYVISTGKLGAAAIANFNPDRDRENRTLRIAQTLVAILSQARSE